MRNNKKAMENIRNLRRYREEKGLSRTELTRLLEFHDSAIRDYETGRKVPNVKSYDKLSLFFGWEILNKPIPTEKLIFEGIKTDDSWEKSWVEARKTEEKKLIKEVKEREEATNFSFNVDEVYYIDGYNLRYVGKKCIHHCFKSVSGGWSRTYTNNQLVGRQIKPQQEKEEALGHYTRKI